MSGNQRRAHGCRVMAVVALAIVGMIAFAVAWPYLNLAPEPTDHLAVATPLSRPPFVKPQPVDSSFVGGASCVPCHQEIAARYQGSPMGRSLQPIDTDAMPESMEHADFAPPGQYKYRVERRDETLVHHEILEDSESVIHDQAEEIAFRIGSGNTMQAYLINREGILYQSPIGYYPAEQRWDFAVGYRPDYMERFGNRIGDECLHCHAGRMLPLEANSNRYEHRVFAEHSIGCERCHGPGQRHVEKQTASKTSLGHDDSIVNPRTLEASRRDSVCNQCHVHGEFSTPRYGYTFFDFRPGQLLDDTRVVFVSNVPGDATDSAAAGHVEQMRLSRCFTDSDGRLGCATCHDPHGDDPAVERSKLNLDRCLQCHNDKGCSLGQSEREQAPANGSCVHCHMPPVLSKNVYHVAHTDHRILRRPTNFSNNPTITNPEEWLFFDGADHRLPLREASRARGLAVMSKAGRRDRELALRAELHLVDGTPKSIPLDKLLAGTNDDIVVLETLGRMYMISDRPEDAMKTWMFGLQKDPNHEALLANIAMSQHQQNEFGQAEIAYENLLAINPNQPRMLGRYSHTLARQEKWDQAIAAAEQAVRFEASIQARTWLAEVYRLGKRIEDSQAQLQAVERMKALGLK